ncbi:hypothetical protein TNCV_408111 [Trichonephila clavipes]|nr:hypothetical protein TNCV_408111 [Trichonephila clavipes]
MSPLCWVSFAHVEAVNLNIEYCLQGESTTGDRKSYSLQMLDTSPGDEVPERDPPLEFKGVGLEVERDCLNFSISMN